MWSVSRNGKIYLPPFTYLLNKLEDGMAFITLEVMRQELQYFGMADVGCFIFVFKGYDRGRHGGLPASDTDSSLRQDRFVAGCL